jgi:hypothetical protein
MKFDSQTKDEPLTEIVVDKEGLLTMISAASAAINYTNEWNFGDEYDTGVTPYHEMHDKLKKQYEKVYGVI